MCQRYRFDTPATRSGWLILVDVGSAITSWRATVLAVQANDGAISPASVMPNVTSLGHGKPKQKGSTERAEPSHRRLGQLRSTPRWSAPAAAIGSTPRIKGIMAAWAGACAVLMLPFGAKWRAALADRVPCGKRHCQTRGGAHLCQNVYHFFG